MPFSVADDDRHVYPEHHWKEVYGGLIRPAIEEAGFGCHRDDDDFSSRPIALNIWKKIEESDIVLCDVSSSSPNVFIELGWAMRAEKPCVIAMDEITKAPFDVADFNRFQYDHTLRPLALREEIPRLARMLKDTFQDPNGRWSMVRSLGIVSPALAKRARPRCTVDIYYYERGFTYGDAKAMCETLQRHSIPFRLMEHSERQGPDAVFIGCMVESDDARLILSLVPYEIKFLFRPDYPEADGGDSSGYKMGLGYFSGYNKPRRSARAEPAAITRQQLAGLINTDHTNTSFHRLVWMLSAANAGLNQ